MPKSTGARKQPFVRFNIVNNGKNFKIFYRPRGTSAHKNFFIHGLLGPLLNFRNRKIPEITTPSMFSEICVFYVFKLNLGRRGGSAHPGAGTQILGERRKDLWNRKNRQNSTPGMILYVGYPVRPKLQCIRSLYRRISA